MRRPVAALGSAAFFLAAPGVVAGLVPWYLTGWHPQRPPTNWLPFQLAGVFLGAAGLLVVIQAFVRFVVEGLGTPAPIAAPTRLVIGGPYRYVRNPMYLAVLAVIVGQALWLGQLGLLMYAFVCWVIAAAFVRWYEEPTLRRRFGSEYDAYRKAVGAWVPRLHAWKPVEP